MPDLTTLNLLESINSPGFDFKPEVITGLLIDQGLCVDQLIFERIGNAKRGFSKDVAAVNLRNTGEDVDKSVIEIKVNRRGIYDGLPEGIFHRSGQSKVNKSKDQILLEFNRHREEEFFARRFFRLFEVESDRTSVLINRLELFYDKKNCHRNFVEVFSEFWPILSHIPINKGVLFLKMVPFFPTIRNSFSRIADVMSLITGVPVEVTLSNEKKRQTIYHNHLGLGKVSLGKEFVLGGDLEDGLKDIHVVVEPMDIREMQDFLPDGIDFRIITCLIDNLFSANRQVDIKYRIDTDKYPFVLGAGKGMANNFLGVNTYMVN